MKDLEQLQAWMNDACDLKNASDKRALKTATRLVKRVSAPMRPRVEVELIRCSAGYHDSPTKVRDAADEILGRALIRQCANGWEPVSVVKDGADWVVVFTRPARAQRRRKRG